MTIIKPIKEIEFRDFKEFCYLFNINTNKIAGDDGTDEELILEEIEKFGNSKWLLNFIDNRFDGYFILQQIEN